MRKQRDTRITPARGEPVPVVVRNVPQGDDGEPSALGFLEPEQVTADINRTLAELGEAANDSKVQVWRLIKGERRPAYVTSYTPQQFSMEKLAEDCGGGMYEAIVYVPNMDADGRQRGVKIATRARVSLDGPPKQIKRPDPEPDPATRPAPSSELAELTAAVKSLVTQRPPSIADAVKDLIALQTLMSAAAPKNMEVTDPFAMFQKVMEFQNTVRSNFEKLPNGASDNQLLLALGRDFLQMFRKANQPGALPQPASEGAPDPAPAPDQPQPPAAEEIPDMDAMKMILGGYVKMLVQNAKANAEVEPIARTIYDQAPDDLIADFLEKEKWLDELASYNESVRLYPIWFGRLRDALKVNYDADQSGAPG